MALLTGAAAGLAGASQISRSAHFATDVLAGGVIGWAAEAVVNGAGKLPRDSDGFGQGVQTMSRGGSKLLAVGTG